MSKTYNHKEYALALADALRIAALHIEKDPTYNVGDDHDVSIRDVEIETHGEYRDKPWVCRYMVVDEFSTEPPNEYEKGIHELVGISMRALNADIMGCTMNGLSMDKEEKKLWLEGCGIKEVTHE
jgi:hypothetical protein